MSVVGSPAEWDDFFSTNFIPQIIDLVLTSWQAMPAPASDQLEDRITVALYCSLSRNQSLCTLPFLIRVQDVEIDLELERETGRKDIAFFPALQADIYFCLECKRLNVVKEGETRAYSSEYVSQGMTRFVSRQYSPFVQHGGMLGYVLDGDVDRAKQNIEANIHARHLELGMDPPGNIERSSVRPENEHIWETHHHRALETPVFRIHHMLVTRTMLTV
ncbi:hypothetical protein [Singulisphaera acidiphila]|uniref:Uncharacterized protein n=1 Tax=Singulisphaera acidiphila (strain ATCC BAA-1392 / DSM 18658 / VKM B-2454 / MOB10) TaxID=886293 RepID=L0DID2_SINAD|nr:hypothetical protein [Singulisphaera acidiphila]AGA28573.1 hypothetical protein Sinac_4379 [Singulisphaera acidiphila DSM 18658]